MEHRNSLFCIRRKATGQFVGFNGKFAWKSAGNAKAAWRIKQPVCSTWNFEAQDELEIVEIQ